MKIKALLMFFLSMMCLTGGFAMEQVPDGGNRKEDCNINHAPCSKIIAYENIRVLFDITPKPVEPMRELSFSVELIKDGQPVDDAKVSLDLTMPDMFMGMNRPAMKYREKGRYEGRGIIPVCPRGGTVWRAEIGIERKGNSVSVSYIFGVD